MVKTRANGLIELLSVKSFIVFYRPPSSFGFFIVRAAYRDYFHFSSPVKCLAFPLDVSRRRVWDVRTISIGYLSDRWNISADGTAKARESLSFNKFWQVGQGEEFFREFFSFLVDLFSDFHFLTTYVESRTRQFSRGRKRKRKTWKVERLFSFARWGTERYARVRCYSPSFFFSFFFFSKRWNYSVFTGKGIAWRDGKEQFVRSIFNGSRGSKLNRKDRMVN